MKEMPKRTIEKYIDNKEVKCVRVKYNDQYRTEVIMSEEEFVKQYGKVD